MGTLSKALGGYGGFVACSAKIRELLINRSRAFIYTTALPPAAVGAALGALEVLIEKPNMGEELLTNAGYFRQQLQDGGLNTGASDTQIVPVMAGESGQALALSRALEAKGVLAVAIRPPTVPEGTARLRFSVSLAHSRADLETATRVVIECAKELGIL